ncbi:MAG TPA: hypothetical protein VI195_01380 [Steroidobacteraceae bacterium]
MVRGAWKRAGLLGAAATLLTLHGAVRGAAPAPGPPLAPVAPAAIPPAVGAPSTDGSFPLTLTLTGSLAGIHPDVAKAAWLCSARILTQPAIDAELRKLQSLSGQAVRTEFSSFLEYRAHYLGQQVTVEVPLASGTTGAVPPISLTMKRDDLIDPATRRAIDQPAVLIGCWLELTNAAGQGGFATQITGPVSGGAPLTTMLQVRTPPWLLASASIANE